MAGEFDMRDEEGSDTLGVIGRRRFRAASLLKFRGVLVVLSKNFFGKSFVLNKFFSIIGRNRGCDIVIRDPKISKRHCAISVGEDGKFFIEDLGSTNKTVVNRKVVKKKRQIFYGDRIVLGDTILRFFLEERLGDDAADSLERSSD
jgi:pSer/pThr/pTyr-binding forkhead associated (FHA) protein